MVWLNEMRKLKAMQRQMLIGIAMVPLFVAVHYAAYWLRFEGQVAAQWTLFTSTALWAVVIKLATFSTFRVYHGWTRYVTFHDFVTICQAATVSAFVMAIGHYMLAPELWVPRSVLFLDWGATVVAVGGIRSFARLVREREVPLFLSAGKTPAFIVGADDSGEALLRSIRRSHNLPYRVVGFIAEHRSAVGSHIGGVPVIGTIEETCELAASLGVPEVLIAAGELPGRQVRQLVEDGRQRDVAVRVLPSYEQLIHGRVDLRPRRVSIEDLLRRDPVRLNMRELQRWLDDRVLLVTGSSGSIGSEICRQLLQFAPRQLVILDRSENGQFFLERELRNLAPASDIRVCLADVNDAPRMNAIFEQYQPDIVFHAAAYKHVPLMEDNPGEAIKNIVLATRTVADLAHRHNVTSFVMISTDKAVNPTSVMGTCKRVAELYVQSLDSHSQCRFVTVRFGNVLDSAGSVVPIFREQIATGGPVTVTHEDMTRFFMTIPEASQLVIQAGAMGKGGEIFVLDMGEPVRILDLARDMIRLSGYQVNDDIEIAIVGMRPGEKLYEELHVDGEEHQATSHPKIMVALSQRRAFHSVAGAIDQLAGVMHGPHLEVVTALHRLVPEYDAPPISIPLPRRRAA